MTIELLHIDCMEYMAGLPDKAFDLAIVDPPYGIDSFKNIKQDGNRLRKHFASGLWNDGEVTSGYFSELFRVSDKQVIWGFNHFCNLLPKSKGFVYWHKHQNGKFAEGELAWCSAGNGRFFDRAYQKDQGYKVHPTQKPIKLYEWLLSNYAKPGQRILDTHLGSGSSAIAAHYGGFDFVGCEIDADYFEAARKRFDRETAQIALEL